MAKAIPKQEVDKRATLNKLGLAKIVEYLKNQFPGIEHVLIIVDEGIAIEGTDIRLVASTVITEEMPTPTAPTPDSAKPLASPLSFPLNPAQQKSPDKASLPIGKAPGDPTTTPNAIGRAGVLKKQEAQTQQMVDRLHEFFPTTDELQKALLDIAQNLDGKK